jgi:hypothetical protein
MTPRARAAKQEPRDQARERWFVAAVLFGMACGAIAAGGLALQAAAMCMG